MIDYLNDNIYSFWFAIGFLLLIIEALALGFSTGFILFVGLGALLTGGAIWLGVVPATWLSSIATFALSSVLISVLLWKPLRAIQRNSIAPKKDNSSDIIGLKFRLEREISTTAPGVTRYSGIEWQVVIDLASEQQSIAAGTSVVVVSVDAGTFWVDVVG
ncbi:MAG: NfeD family protein [Thiotrichaceae bacterium]|nr:NfeD family protein [Thiotrichaceae bacterium]PCI14055.1 MAG: activity regulator of membrane protease YbbK [Thiotrichales bacterium]